MNLPTFLVAVAVAALFCLIVYREIRNRRSGKGSCSCGCENCGGCAHRQLPSEQNSDIS